MKLDECRRLRDGHGQCYGPRITSVEPELLLLLLLRRECLTIYEQEPIVKI